ncbi:putative membrane protein [Corynebacterium uterequi]|uniref:Putative membrane protein n=2 Tax=Corynebacterium uterequi TaxID=1072256 RepID=A0A0G3HA59_9CORY|nr:putative membrane protein [Corynebacterium uterequi]
MPGPDPELDAQRRRALRNYKAFVTGLLGLAAVIFFACSYWQAHPGSALGVAPSWVGYVRAAAEAGMVGGLADWFAVTALFRHPLGVPIPHTALIPKKKDQLGGALSEFVGDNFLNPQLITEKVANAEVPEKIGSWLVQDDHAQIVSREVGRFLVKATRAVDPLEAQALIDTHLVQRVAEPKWGPHIGRFLDSLIADGKTEPMVDAVIAWSRRRIRGAESSIVSMIDDRMPSWAPQFAKDLVGERVFRELVAFVEEIDRNPDHEARRTIRRFIAQLATDLKHDPMMIARVESVKRDLMGSAAVKAAPGRMWEVLSAAIIDAASDDNSALRVKIAETCLDWGERVHNDAELRARLDQRITAGARFLAENYSGEVTAIISETIEGWDAAEASDKIEVMVGKDLQFIRLNGTIVGALAGLLIYTVNQLLFG